MPRAGPVEGNTVHARARTLFAAATLALGAQVAVAAPSHAASPGIAVAPYEYLGWGNPQKPASVMSATW